MLAWYDEATIISLFDKEKIKIEPNCIVVVSNGVDTKHFKRTEIEKKYEILFSGNLSYLPNKNAVQYLAEKIAPKLVAYKPEINIEIAGASGNDLKKYDSSIYSGPTIGELDNLLFFKGISENFTQKDLITTDHFGLNQFCQTDIGEGIKIKSKIKNNPQTFAGYFF